MEQRKKEMGEAECELGKRQYGTHLEDDCRKGDGQARAHNFGPGDGLHIEGVEHETFIKWKVKDRHFFLYIHSLRSNVL